VQQLAQLERQYAQLVQTYQMVRSQYNQMLWMARQIPCPCPSATARLGCPGSTQPRPTPTGQPAPG
jgi:hypothetical protein